MYYIITNIEKGDNFKDRDNFFILSESQDGFSSITGDLTLYYAMYNHKKVKIAIYNTFKEWYNSNEFKVLKEYHSNIENVGRYFNPGSKEIDWSNPLKSALPLEDRLYTRKQFNEMVKELELYKEVNQLNW